MTTCSPSWKDSDYAEITLACTMIRPAARTTRHNQDVGIMIELMSEGQPVLVNQDQIIWAQRWEGSVDFNKGNLRRRFSLRDSVPTLTVDQSLDELLALSSDVK
ncbi:MAG TPA: hypothetical protein VGI47_03170 [Candidatus Binataceae bacterium]